MPRYQRRRRVEEPEDVPPEAVTARAEAEREAAHKDVRHSQNAWWCPDDDRAMPLTEPPTPCDRCGKVPADFRP